MQDFISVDIEASGPIPGKYSMLSLGACLVEDISTTFYKELQPVSDDFVAAAMHVSGFSLQELKEKGEDPKKAMEQFLEWVNAHAKNPVFVGCNAPFDWQFVNYYFHRYIGKNPFGYAALDAKSMFFGMAEHPWKKTTLKDMKQYTAIKDNHTHHALEDAISQGKVFKRLLERKKHGHDDT